MEEKKEINLKETVLSIIEDSTVHGIPRILKANYLISKLAWTLGFLISTGFCVYLIVAAILNYLKYDVVTSVETITEIPADFPVVTICNLNQLQTNYSTSLIQKYAQMSSFSNVFKVFFMMSEINSYNDTFKKSLSYTLTESLISCTISTMPCSASDFVWSFDPTYGNCYSFNTGLNSSGNSVDFIQISKAGNKNGLRLQLFIGNPNNIPDFYEISGYHVIIHNQTYKISMNEGYDISTGSETNLAINIVYEELKPYPYSECIELSSINSFDSYLYRVIYGLNQTYRQVDCFDYCFQQLLINTCQCYAGTLNKLFGTTQCLNLSQLYCMTNTWNSFLLNNYISKTCIQYCPLECYSINYQVTTSFSNYPNYNYAVNSLINSSIITSKFPNQTYDSIKQSVLSLNVYYDQLSYTQISKDAKLELVDLISGIGGLLGLFLGMSFLSFAEFIEIILEALVISLKRIKDKKKEAQVFLRNE